MSATSRIFTVFALCVMSFMLSGCSEMEFGSHLAKKVTWPGQEETAGTYKIGKPYRAGSVWYYPQEDFKYVETGIASWYGPDFHGHRTANGEVYDQHELTAAHRTLQMPSLVRVTNLENGRSVVVRINDRGPFKSGRIIDCSERAAQLLGFIGKGTARVKLEVLTKESKQMAEAAKRGMDTSRLTMADLDKFDTPATVQNASYETHGDVAAETGRPQYASLDTTQNDALPESLQTPTITVEQLSAPASAAQPPAYAPPDVARSNGPQPVLRSSDRDNFVGSLNLDDTSSAPRSSSGGLASGHMEQGRFMPDPVVKQVPVAPTGIFVQAGAFGVRDNADRLKGKLQGIAPVMIDTISANGKTLYRVKLGPIATVAEADKVLADVIRTGNGAARVVHDR